MKTNTPRVRTIIGALLIALIGWLTGGVVTTADAATMVPQGPPTGLTVSLSASTQVTWPLDSVTLTATANASVPAPFQIFIINEETGAVVRSCGVGAGATCGKTLTYPTPEYYQFYAMIATDSSGTSLQAESANVPVDWQGITLSLAASANTLPVGGTSTLTATSNIAIDKSPFFIEIWDVTNATPVLLPTTPPSCGGGTTCTATVSQNTATTHTYRATFSYQSSAYPPPALQTTSPDTYVTWADNGWTVSLSAYSGIDATTVNVTTNVDVGPTPYFIEVFDEKGNLVTSCSKGTTCSAHYGVSPYPGNNLVAFIAGLPFGYPVPPPATLPPPSIQASSNTVTAYAVIG